MTDDANRAGDAGPQAESAVDSTVSDGIPDAQPRRRRRKTRRIRKDQIDITKAIASPYTTADRDAQIAADAAVMDRLATIFSN